MLPTENERILKMEKKHTRINCLRRVHGSGLHATAFALVAFASLGLHGLLADDLVFNVPDGETREHADAIGASCTRIVKDGGGTLTLTAPGDAEFAGAVEVNAGLLKVARVGSLGTPASITVRPGATLDLGGSDEERGAQPWCASLTLGGGGCAGATGALVRNSGVAWDRMFRDVSLTDDAVVDLGVETGFGHGTLAMGGHSLTKRGAGIFQLQKDGAVTGDGDVIAEGPVLLERTDLSAGDPGRNRLVARSRVRWWTTAKPVNWRLRVEGGGSLAVEDPTSSGFGDARLWAGPVETADGVSLTNYVNNVNAATTFADNLDVGGELTLQGRGSTRLQGASIALGAIAMARGHLQLSPAAGAKVSVSGAASANGFLECLCAGSSVSFVDELSMRFIDSLTVLKGGDYSIGGETKIGSVGVRSTWDISGGARVEAVKHINLGYSVSGNKGHVGAFSVRGEGTSLHVANGAVFKVSRTANTEEIVNVSGGAVLASPRLQVTTPSTVPTAAFYLNFDGGIVKPTYGYGWFGNANANSGYEPTAVTLFEGGLTVDLSECWKQNVAGGSDGTREYSYFCAPLKCPGEGRRIASISLPTDEDFSTLRYAEVPPVRISGCTGASAYLALDPVTRQPKEIVVTSCGWGLADDATATVASPDGQTTYSCTIVAEDQPADGWQGLTVRGGAGSMLYLQDANTYRGPTTVRDGGILRFNVQEGRPLTSGLIVEKGSEMRFGDTDQSDRPVPFVQGGGTVSGFTGSLRVNAIRATAAELLRGEFPFVKGALVLPSDATVRIVDPENIDLAAFGAMRQVVKATRLTLEGGVAGLRVDAGDGRTWRVRVLENGLALRPPAKGSVMVVR